MKAGEAIGAWILVESLGSGEAGATWLAVKAAPATEGGEGGEAATAVLKILDLGAARDWSGFDLLGREIEAIKRLDHPGIPRFIESFQDSSQGDSRLVLAMDLMPGVDLATLVSSGRHFSDGEVASILADLADILAYLGSLRPPVVHRDVNPRNVLLASDGRLSLVDFSGAQDALLRGARPGVTLIGTAGYIPLEQVSGRATARSDLYGAAATALFLLTGANPTELAMKDLKPDLSALPSLDPGLALVLGSWLEPDEARRGIEPSEAARMLRGEVELPSRPQGPAGRNPPNLVRPEGGRQAVGLPSDSRVTITEGGGSLRIVIPALGLSSAAALGIGGFSLFWLAFVAFWTFMAIAMKAPVFFVLFSLPFWAVGIGMVKAAILPLLSRTELLLDAATGLTLVDRIVGKGRRKNWPASDLGKCSLRSSSFQTKGSARKELMIEAGATSVTLGRNLSERELHAIKDRIEAWKAASP